MNTTPSVVAAREAARQQNGQFGEQPHSAPEVSLAVPVAQNEAKALASLSVLENEDFITFVHLIGDGASTRAVAATSGAQIIVDMNLPIPFYGVSRVNAGSLGARGGGDAAEVSIAPGDVYVDGHRLPRLGPDDPGVVDRLEQIITGFEPAPFERAPINSLQLRYISEIVLPSTGQPADRWVARSVVSNSNHWKAVELTPVGVDGVRVILATKTQDVRPAGAQPAGEAVEFSIEQVLSQVGEGNLVITEDGSVLRQGEH